MDLFDLSNKGYFENLYPRHLAGLIDFIISIYRLFCFIGHIFRLSNFCQD